MEYLDRFFQTHKLHYSSGNNYNDLWNNVACKLTPQLPRNKKFKVRIYDFYFYNLTFNKTYNTLIISEYQKNKKLEDFKFDQSLFVEFRIKYKKDWYGFPIYHVYQTEDYTVLYSIPDARTLTRAYKNNPIIADEKLKRFCNNNFRNQIIESARKI